MWDDRVKGFWKNKARFDSVFMRDSARRFV